MKQITLKTLKIILPRLQPVEEAFSKVKANLRAMDIEADCFEDPEDLVLAAFSSITVDNCQQWIGHAGIYNHD